MNILTSTEQPEILSADQIIEIYLPSLKVRTGVVGAELHFDIESTLIEWKQSVRLSYYNSSARLTSPNIFGAYLELNLAFSDDTGQLRATTQFHSLLGSAPPVSISLQLLPRFVLGLVTLGANLVETLKHAAQIAELGLNYDACSTFGRLLATTANQSGVDSNQFQAAMRERPAVYETIINNMPTDRATLETLRTIPASAWEEALVKVVRDPRIRAIYPGIENVIVTGHSEAATTGATDAALMEGFDVQNAKPIEIARDIIGDISTFAGIAGGALSGIAAIIGGLVALFAVPPLTPIAIGLLVVALILTVIGFVLLGVGLVTFIVYLILKYIIVFGGTATEVMALTQDYMASLHSVGVNRLAA